MNLFTLASDNKSQKEDLSPVSTISLGMEDKKLRIITLSGTESVTKNMTVYEYGDDIIVVDCGVGFPDSDMLGVDVVIPDMSYLEQHADKVKALFITHGHEDHIGAVPYFVQKLPNVPIYTNRLVQGFIKVKLNDRNFKGLADKARFVLIEPDMPEFVLGGFKVSAFRVNHSVPASMGFAIETAQGVVLHMADYKVDWTPVLDPPIDIAKIAMYGSKGVLCLMSDCLGSTHEGFTKSESTLSQTFFDLMEEAEGRQMFITTISSNLSRMHQIITAAIKHGRKIVLAGRSIDQNVTVARGLGYLPFDEGVFVKDSEAQNFAQKDLVYIIAGCYGQQGSALDRLARKEHEQITLEENAMVVFSADPNPPTVGEDVERLMSNLTINGAEVIYSKIQDNLHVSGHGTKGDLTMIAALVKPKYFIPIGGTITKMRAYSHMVEGLRVKKEQVLEMMEGDSYLFNKGVAEKGPKVPVTKVFVEGKTVGGISPLVMRDRESLSTDGVFVVVVPIGTDNKPIIGKVEVITRGFVYVKENKSLLGRARDIVNKGLEKNADKSLDWNNLRNRIENDVEKFLYKETGRNPLILVHAINI